MSRKWPWWLLLSSLLLWSSGCVLTGLTFGENGAGDDTYLDDGDPPVSDDHAGEGEGWCVFNGSLAVDDRTDEVYTLVTTAAVECDEYYTSEATAEPTKELYVVGPTDNQPRRVMDLTGRDDVRVLFPQDRLLVMSERVGRDVLSFVEPVTHEVQVEMERPVRYHGTRLSPSRRFVAVADNTSSHSPINLIDTVDPGLVEIDHEGDWLEAMWLNRSDTLVGIVFYDWPGVGIACDDGSCEIDSVCLPETSARIMTWSLAGATAAGIAENPDGVWSRPELDLAVQGACADAMFSFTWVGVSPDDRYAVFPVRVQTSAEAWGYQLLVVDLTDGSIRRVDDAMGPVGFTPDGSTIVSYRYVEEVSEQGEEETSYPELVLIDVDTLEETAIELRELDFGPQFFVTHTANVVVITTALGGDQLLIHDLDTGTTTSLEHPSYVSLDEFVSRDSASELWLVSGDELFRLDYLSPAFEQVELGFGPDHVNLLPGADLLVLDDVATAQLAFFDPDGRSVTRRVSLPTPE